MFSNKSTRRSFLRTSVLASALTAAITRSPGRPASAAYRPVAARSPSAAPLDLAAMVLTPLDLADAGHDDFGISSARTLSADTLADRAVWPAGLGETFTRAREDLLSAGFLQAHGSLLTTIRDIDHPGPIRDIEVEIVSYTTAAGAATGFALIPDAYATGDVEHLVGTKTFGDESRITRLDAHDAGAGTSTPELALGFRHDRITARILVRSITGASPTVPEIEPLAALLLSRIVARTRNIRATLGLRTLRLIPKDDFTVAEDFYLRLDGQDLRSAFESETEFALRTSSYADAVDIFTTSTEIHAHDSDYALSAAISLFRFPTAAQASAWLDAAEDRSQQEPDFRGLIDPTIVPDLGDEAVAMAMAQDPGDDEGEVIISTIVVSRVGPDVVQIRLTRIIDAPPLATAWSLAHKQVDCVSAVHCLTPIAVTISATGDLDETPRLPQSDAIGTAVAVPAGDK